MKMIITKKTSLPIRTVLFLIFCIFSSPVLAADSNASPIIAVLPFKVNAATDMTYIKSGLRDMIASRLASRVGARIISPDLVDQAAKGMSGLDSPDLIASIGRTLSADYIISGSFTSFAGTTSLDAVLHSLQNSGSKQQFNASAAKEDELIQAVDSLTWDIAVKAFAKKRPDTYQRRPVVPVQTSTASSSMQSAHPDRYLMGRYAEGLPGSQLVRPTGLITSPMGFTKSQNLQFGMVAMAVGDVDGDGNSEFILASSREVQIFREIGRKLQKIAEASTPYSRYKIHSVTLADLNHNGIADICVSAADPDGPNSFILEWDGQGFTEISRDQKWYIRSMEIPGEGVVLVGQKSSMNQILSRGLYRLTLSGATLLKGEKIDVRGVNLFEFEMADLDGDGKNEIIAVSQADKLMVLRPNGATLWLSDEYYGGTTRFIGGESAEDSMRNLEHGSDSPRIFLPARIIVRDVNNDGQLDVVINKNPTNMSRIMARYRSYPSGEIQALTWNGIGLTELWRTRKIDGYIADYVLGPINSITVSDKEGKETQKSMAELHVGLVLSSGGINILNDSRSTVLTFPLEIRSDYN